MKLCKILESARFLPPANEVWGKVICLQMCVCPQGGPGLGGAWSRRGLVPRGSGLGECLVHGGAWSRRVWSRGGAWWRPPPMATAAGGAHPTEMHSCLENVLGRFSFFYIEIAYSNFARKLPDSRPRDHYSFSSFTSSQVSTGVPSVHTYIQIHVRLFLCQLLAKGSYLD